MFLTNSYASNKIKCGRKINTNKRKVSSLYVYRYEGVTPPPSVSGIHTSYILTVIQNTN